MSAAGLMTCPIPLNNYPKVLLAHGGGGRLMQQLIEKMFYATFDGPELQSHHDGALLDLEMGRIAVTTDSYVVSPLFFPGGDIGSLAVNGTVNDLAMCGAQPLYLTLSFILEEGLPMETLWQVTQSIHQAAEQACVRIVTGDTKVINRGSGDGLYINTTGIGAVSCHRLIGPQAVRPGDMILLNGDIGRHGMAVMSAREQLTLNNPIISDSAPLADLVMILLEAGLDIHCMRDATRGGVAAVLNEIAQAGKVQLEVDEDRIPVPEDVHGLCEILGLDPLHVANEGRFLVFIAEQDAPAALTLMQRHPLGEQAVCIGRVTPEQPPLVKMRTPIGGSRILDFPAGEQMPRIC